MKRLAIVDIPKSGGNPVLNLPESVEVRKRGPLWHLSHPDEGQLFARVVFENASRWVAVVAAPGGAYTWIKGHLGADVYPITWQWLEDNESSMNAIGLASEQLGGATVWRMPHVICGQHPFIAQE